VNVRWRVTRLALLSAVLGTAFGACAPDAPTPDGWSGGVRVTSRVTRGEVHFRVTGEGARLPDGTAGSVALAGPAGLVTARAVARAGALQLRVPFSRAGAATYHVTVGNARVRGRVRIAPGTPVRMHAWTDPRAVRAVGNERVPLVVAQAYDAQGNVTPLAVRVVSYAPGARSKVTTATVRHLLAWIPLPAPSRTGTLNFSVQSGLARLELGALDVLPGVAATGVLRAEVATGWGDGRDAWQLRLRNVTDSAGNRAANGTAVTVTARGPGALRYDTTVPTVEGDALVTIPVPPGAGRYVAEGRVDAARLGPLALVARSPLRSGSLPVRWNGATLRIGRIVTARGALPDTGTPVTVQWLSASGRVLREEVVPLVAGSATYDPPPVPAGAVRLRVRVLGAEATLPLGGAR